MKKFGIIAGAGSMAGAYTYKSIISFFSKQKECKDSDFPHLKIINYPFSSMNETGVSDVQMLEEEVLAVMSDLRDCDYILIACNSMYSYVYSFIPEDMAAKVISLPKLINSAKNFDQSKKTLVVSSQSSRDENLFDFIDSNFSYLDNEIQDKMNVFIKDKIQNKTNVDFAQQLEFYIKENNFEQIILGCTELYIDSEQLQFKGINTINPCDLISEFIFKVQGKNNIKKPTILEKIFPSYLFSYDKELG